MDKDTRYIHGTNHEVSLRGKSIRGKSINLYELKNVKFAYEKELTVDIDSLQVTKGKITTIIGPNGSGKSTLLNLLSKNLKPNEGEISLEGMDISKISRKEFARRVSMVHQNNTAPSDITVEKLVQYGRTPYKSLYSLGMNQEDREKVEWAMEVTDVTCHRDKPISNLSGGERQRVWIAMALAQATDTIFLDEPTTFLDIKFQLEILGLARSLNCEYGMTVVMVLHDINQALHYSHELVALKDGKLLEKGEPSCIVRPEIMRELYDVDLEIADVCGNPFVLTV